MFSHLSYPLIASKTLNSTLDADLAIFQSQQPLPSQLDTTPHVDSSIPMKSFKHKKHHRWNLKRILYDTTVGARNHDHVMSWHKMSGCTC